MKKFSTFVIICLLLSSCGIHQINSKYFKWNEEIDFMVVGFFNVKMTEGQENNKNVTYIARKNSRFKRASFRFKNNTNQPLEINFENLFLLDKFNRKYPTRVAGQAYKGYSNDVFELQRPIKANEEALFLLEFFPAFPKDEVITKITIDTSDSETLSENARIISLVTE